MYTLRNYTDTKCELEMAKTRLNLVIDKKITIYANYFPITTKPKEVSVDESKVNADKMADYLDEINTVDIGTGMSIEQEIEYQQTRIEKLEGYLEIMSVTLSKMSGIEYKLFYEIVYKGTNITKAVDIIAEETGKDTSTIWKNYYSKIKKDIKKISNFEKLQ
ncbi:hypothetical protein IJE86_01375 [bacterium]|nr:hypothetical protein [bacterium]